MRAWHFGLGPIDAATASVMAALGNSPTVSASPGISAFNLIATIAGFVLLYVLLAHITALVLAERLQERMTRRASHLRNHVIVVGLGKLGYRIVQLLNELGVPTVVIEREPDSRFANAVGLHTPVLTGDGQLAENLERCGVEHARCIIACTEDDLANLAACLEARAHRPTIRTVTRAFDEALTTRLQAAFQIDTAISSTAMAASAFVGAAADELATRTIELDDLELLAFRLQLPQALTVADQARWRASGVRLLAVLDGRVAVGAREVGDVPAGAEVVVIGRADTVQAITGAATAT